MKTILLLFSLVCNQLIFCQSIANKLAEAFKILETDKQFKHALLGMSVIDSKTGLVVFEKNAQIGFAPASCQKVITSASAFELLGKDYSYTTTFNNYSDLNYKDVGDVIVVKTSGDPSLGSMRWEQTKPDVLIQGLGYVFKDKVKQNGLKYIIMQENWSTARKPRGWIWEDIGNYFGAGASAMNWRENQYDLFLKSSSEIDSKVNIVKTEPQLSNNVIKCEVKAAAKGTGDNTIIYFPEDTTTFTIRGTIPISQTAFKVSGAMLNPLLQFKYELNEKVFCCFDKKADFLTSNETPKKFTPSFYQHHSPPFDSLNYWFLKKSINLYGEAFVKTIAYEKKHFGDTDSGIAIIKNFWQQKGIESSSINIIDGSGLSPANRVTPIALTSIMQYAKKQSWFSSYYNALPEMNGIKMKDGYISGVRSYTGYIKSKSGTEYTFSFIVNNFDGSPATVREKMWQVLNILK